MECTSNEVIVHKEIERLCNGQDCPIVIAGDYKAFKIGQKMFEKCRRKKLMAFIEKMIMAIYTIYTH